ncbi:hypothetical protein [Lactiplantibacillus modestisalitolerans]|uniref:Extracellular protein n=1 Tax=Lactiplantibacillus modestisalitolerans TaxID=1457219 RepID=A0ABV5WW08_9LACO|nr:hypothetical protein [Lactiplantibacillus modestisalitolerans]
MRKVILSSVLVAGAVLLGGGLYVWPRTTTRKSSEAVQTSVSQSHKTGAKHIQVTKKATTKAVTTAQPATGTVESATSQTDEKAGSSSVTATSGTSSTTSASGQGAVTSASSAASSQTTTATSAASTSGTATSASAATTTLTAEQVNDWVWQQVAPGYATTKLTRSDFGFQNYQRNGLAYVDVYEQQHPANAHLVGRFRVNAQGQLERQLAVSGNWQTVANATH